MMFGLQRYLGIEKDFIDASFYVSLDQSAVYSEFFTREIILLGAEIEAAFKTLCSRLDRSSTPGNIGGYKEIILKNLPNLPQIGVIDKHYGNVENPFADWVIGGLQWWTVYTGIKHSLVDRNANLGVAITMLKAYLLLLFCITAMEDDIHIDYIDVPKLFQVDLPEEGLGFTTNLVIERKYRKDVVLDRLGYWI